MTALVGNAIGGKDHSQASTVARQGVGFASLSALLLVLCAYLLPLLC